MDKHAGAVAGDGGEAAPVSGPSVFLSYSRADLERARPVIALLEGAGFDVWWDGRLEGGENYLATTENALETADCVAVLWSQTSVASHWVRDEAQRGRERGCLVPLSLDGTMAPLGFRQFQLLDISGWSGDPADALAARILVAVRTRAGQSVAAGETPAAIAPAPPAAAPRLAVLRRALMLGGAGLAGTAALFGVWKSGILSGGGGDAISMVVLTFFGVAFPTLGANLSGIRYFGDCERFGAISRVAAEKLGEIEARIALLLSGAESALTYAAAADLIHALDEAVVDEIESWQSVFGAKHLSLPA
jgi:hypothetical protein